ncbi:MAG: hypothetical protein M0Z80_02275 [Treponema sp.]|nr:hypothetical protein [Treponema sp.]
MKNAKDGRLHYYTVHDRQPVLDAPFALCSAWRIGIGRERERLYRFQSVVERDRMIRKLVSRRLRDGYRLIYSFSRAGFAGETDILLEQAFVSTGGGAKGEVARTTKRGSSGRSYQPEPPAAAEG